MFKLSIETANAAFEPDKQTEIARILRDIADRLEGDGHLHGSCYDYNGNVVGDYGQTR